MAFLTKTFCYYELTVSILCIAFLFSSLITVFLVCGLYLCFYCQGHFSRSRIFLTAADRVSAGVERFMIRLIFRAVSNHQKLRNLFQEYGRFLHCKDRTALQFPVLGTHRKEIWARERRILFRSWFTWSPEEGKFRKNVSLSAGDSVSLLLIVMRVSTRFLAKVDLGRKANMETVDLETYMELCRSTESQSPEEPGGLVMLTYQSTEDSADHSAALLNCRKNHSTISSGIWPSFENDDNGEFVFCLKPVLFPHNVQITKDGKKMSLSFTTSFNQQRTIAVCVPWPTFLDIYERVGVA